MKYKILLVENPKAGKSNTENYIREIEYNLKKLNYEIVIKYTTIENNATDIIKKYDDDYDTLIVCGGDGTLNEAIQGICEIDKKVFIGFIPMGTANDFAKSLNTSFDKLHLSKNINNYEAKKIDIGVFSKRIFNNGCKKRYVLFCKQEQY